MIPLVDDYLQFFIVDKLRWLKKHPFILETIFQTGKRETLDKLKDFILKRPVSVVIGYPKEQNRLPAYVITLAPESEQPLGLGDDYDAHEGYDLGISDKDEKFAKEAEFELSRFISSTFMNSNYRIECWSDNGDLTSYMYIILKWCMWASRQQMLQLNWNNIRVSGTDLEPVPDYMPMFIYRRALQIDITYEALYFEHLAEMEKYVDILDNYEKYKEDEDGNLVDEDGTIIIAANDTWILRAHIYHKKQYAELTPEEEESWGSPH